MATDDRASQRDRHPSDRYIGRLAERVAKELAGDALYASCLVAGDAHGASRVIEWCLIRCASQLRDEDRWRDA